MKRAGLVGLLAVGVAMVLWSEHGGDDRARSSVTYRDQRTAVAPRRAPPHDPVAAAAAPATGALGLDGLVIGPDGQAIGGASVVLDPGPATARTAADGRFSFDHLERRAYSVVASAGALVAGPIKAAVTDAPHRVVMRLASGGFQRVKVVDGSSQPIVGAEVHARVSGWTSAMATAAEGTVTLGPLPPGYAAIAVVAPGYAPDAATVLISAGATDAATTIILHRGTPLSGRVVDENHEPIAGARITVAGSRGALTVAPIVSNDGGAFAIPALVPGTYTVQASDDEHARARSAPVVVAAVPVDGVEIVMKEAGVISGVVLDDRSRPVPFARISAVEVAGGMREATADHDGAFELRGLDRYFIMLRAGIANATSSAVEVNLSEKAQADVELVLDAVGTIAGSVVDERGGALAGIFVTASPDWGHMPPGVRQPVALGEAITDGDGTFVLHGLAEIPYLVDARRRRTAAHPLLWSRHQSVRSARVGDRDLQIRLVPEGRITGRIVLGEAGGAPSSAVVTLWQGAPTPANRDGSFQIDDVVPGDHWISFESPDFDRFSKGVVEVQTGATLDLGTLTATRSRTLVGRVIDSAGAPVGGAQVEVGVIRPPPFEVDDPAAGFHAYGSAIAAPDGTFRVDHVPAAPMIAIASGATYGSSEGTPVPGGAGTPDDPTPVTLVLSRVRDRR